MSARLAVLAAILLAGACAATKPPVPSTDDSVIAAARDNAPDATAWTSQCKDWDDWDTPAAPFRIHGDTYHVGTCGISAILVAGPRGHVLIDSGTSDGAQVVLNNIRALGFQPRDLRAVLTSHEHYDHVGGLWLINQLTGAPIITSPGARSVIESGMADPADPQFGLHDAMRAVARRHVETVEPGETITLAGHEFTPVATPGHTPGALTWQWESCEEIAGDEDCVSIVYADSLSAVSADNYRFSDHPEYLLAFREGLARLAALDCDILLTPHPSASRMREKLLRGDLTSGMGCAAYAADRLKRLEARLAKEAAS